jgi:alkyl hydroperoxide reductase subunit AhpF
MAFIGERDRATIAQIFEESLDGPVQVHYFTIPTSKLIVPGRATCETCADVQQLIDEVASISDKVSVEVHNFESEREEAHRFGVTRVPAIVIKGKAQGVVRYYGAPAGSEFPNFIQDIQHVSRGETALSPETREALGAITDPIHLQVFVTPT